MYIQNINSEVNDMQFDQIKNMLIEIQGDKTLQAQCLRDAEKLYSELFVIDETFTGNDVIESLKDQSEFNRNSTIDAYLHNILIFEKDMLTASNASNKNGTHVYSEYLNILNEKIKKQIEFDNLKNELSYQNNDDYYLEQLYEKTFEDEYSKDEFLSKKDYLFEIFKTTEFCCICNYKGEIESDDLKINTLHLRKFHGKYDYS